MFKASKRPPSRRVIVEGEVCRTIPLHGGFEAIVNAKDFKRVSEHLWFVKISYDTAYARRVIRSGGVARYQGLHTYLINPKNGREVDHRNGNGLDNRRSNLRPATHRQNQRNRKKVNGASKYKGVSWCKRTRRWESYIHVNGKKRLLGHFKVESDAAGAYDKAARIYYRNFASLNFPANGEVGCLI
jgi:HNH endonuclease/AP2 domain